MSRYPMTEIVAQREFDYVGPNGAAKIVATIGKPAHMPDFPSDWYCPCVIEGPDGRRQLDAAGVDAIQALLMALSAMRADLRHIARRGKLTFLGDDDISIDLVGGAG